MTEQERINTEKASTAITQALQDVEKIEASSKFTINMAVWMDYAFPAEDGSDALEPLNETDYAMLSEPQKQQAVCQVCLGGAVLANRYDYESMRMSGLGATPSALDDEDERRMVMALDGIRQRDAFDVGEALCDMGVAHGVAMRAMETALRAAGEMTPFDTFDEHEASFTTYEESPEKFKRQRRILASELALQGY